jgi:hypothetical protein
MSKTGTNKGEKSKLVSLEVSELRPVSLKYSQYSKGPVTTNTNKSVMANKNVQLVQS